MTSRSQRWRMSRELGGTHRGGASPSRTESGVGESQPLPPFLPGLVSTYKRCLSTSLRAFRSRISQTFLFKNSFFILISAIWPYFWLLPSTPFRYLCTSEEIRRSPVVLSTLRDMNIGTILIVFRQLEDACQIYGRRWQKSYIVA